MDDLGSLELGHGGREGEEEGRVFSLASLKSERERIEKGLIDRTERINNMSYPLREGSILTSWTFLLRACLVILLR
jgi:hypothetical protein